MSGIAGIFHCAERRPAEERVVQQMLRGIAHRGPDGSNVWTAGPIGLGHCMLWTTPESLHEKQPLSSEDGGLRLIADARVDNRTELRAALLANGAQLRDDTDAELILWSYATWGESCPAKIIGDFAFAIWDARSQRLFCARDPIGIKPFFYHFDGRTFRFGSAPQALFADGAISPQPNLRFISRYLLNRFEDREETLHKDILRLPPAFGMVVEREQLRKSRYWELDPSHAIRYQTDAEYAEHFLEIFRAAVSASIRSHGPVGALLSGGLDSSSVVCVAQEIQERNNSPLPLEAFSLVFDDMPCDERSYIAAVAQKCNLQVHHVHLDEHLSWLDFERSEEYVNCAYRPNLFMIGPALEVAQRSNVRTMLTGIGGDNVTASTVFHLADLVRQGRITDLFRQLRYDADLASCSQWSLFRDYCVRPLIPSRARTVLRFLAKPLRNSSPPAWLTAECIRHAGDSAPANGRKSKRFPTAAQQRMHDKLEGGWNLDVALGRLDDFASYFAIEFRHPFFDRRLVEFMLAVPEEQRWFGPWRKTILRRAMTGILPESVRCRTTKANFNPVIEREFKGRQAEKAQQLLQSSAIGDLGLIHVQELQRLYDRYRHAQVTATEMMGCQNAIELELWCRSATVRAKDFEMAMSSS